MATRTASVSGKASSTATWGGAAIPVNGDAIIVNAGVVLEWDLDTSGFASGLIASTINGTLRVTNTPGTYHWKCAAQVSWGAAARFEINDGAGGALPADVVFTQEATGNITLNSFNAATVIDIRCQEPAHKVVRTLNAEGIGDTVLEVDTDLTGDPLWAVGARIRIDNINQGVQSEERIIQSVTSSAITITAGLTAAKLQGSYIALISRNVKFVGAGTGTALSSPQTPYIAAEIRGFATGISGGNGGQAAPASTFGGSISTCTTGINSHQNAVIDAVISGCTSALNGIASFLMRGVLSGCTRGIGTATQSTAGIISGLITGCTDGIGGSQGLTITGEISNCQSAVNGGTGFVARGAQFRNNTRDFRAADSVRIYGALMGTQPFNLYNQPANGRNILSYSESIDHNQIAGGFLSATLGGLVSDVSSPAFDGTRPRSYRHVPESTAYPCYMQQDVLVPPGETISVTCHVRKDASMGYLPRLQVFSIGKEPLLSGTPDVEAVMTDSVDTWETLEAEVTNAANYPVTYRVRTLAKNASGNVYFDPMITVGGAGGASMNLDVGMTGGLVAA